MSGQARIRTQIKILIYFIISLLPSHSLYPLQVKVATIKHITGKRLYLEYDDFDTDDNGELHVQFPLKMTSSCNSNE